MMSLRTMVAIALARLLVCVERHPNFALQRVKDAMRRIDTAYRDDHAAR